MLKNLREYIKAVMLEEKSQAHKKLRIFDFDDTLVKTKSMVTVTSASGETFKLTPGEYAIYDQKSGDHFDYKDFNKLIDPKAIKWTVKILQNIVSAGSEVIILTARGSQDPVKQFLEDVGLPPIEVIALADADPQKKADFISERISKDDLTWVEFFDDSPKNIEAVNKLKVKHPGVVIKARLIVHRNDDLSMLS